MHAFDMFRKAISAPLRAKEKLASKAFHSPSVCALAASEIPFHKDAISHEHP
jgi:hypothetical protein